MRTDKVALLTCESDIGRIAARYLAARFPGLAVVVERNIARSLLLRRRVKRLGWIRVGGQVAFMTFSAGATQGFERAHCPDCPASEPRTPLARRKRADQGALDQFA